MFNIDIMLFVRRGKKIRSQYEIENVFSFWLRLLHASHCGRGRGCVCVCTCMFAHVRVNVCFRSLIHVFFIFLIL